jgi:cysteinyl-tRNA synthetase
MPIYFYNSLTKKKEEFKPLIPGHITLYTCGVTVYDDCHIGHARSLYIFDCLKRYLKYRGFLVKFVRNITDVDDKIIDRARKENEGEPLIDTVKMVTQRYIERYYEDMEALGIERADIEPKATENISGMVAHIEGLLAKGFAYVTESGVYFSVRKFNDYGRLSGQGITQMQSGTRIEPDEAKQDPLDFALWKKSKPNEPSWPSPWGEGRPGWHIECSVMSAKYLGVETLDIHAGGRDLIFPHHENEIAQSEALTGKPFARYWLHHGLLAVEGRKMAKSLGNFVTVRDFSKRQYPIDALKLFFLQAHYSQALDFSWERIDEKRSALETILTFLSRVRQKHEDEEFFTKPSKDTKCSPEWLCAEVEKAKNDFLAALDDDFNTPQAQAALFEIINASNKALYDIGYTGEYLPALTYARGIVLELGGILGLSLSVGHAAIPESQIKMSMEIRDKLKKQKQYEEADKIRRELEIKGIILEDTKDGTKWRRKV